MSRIFAPVDKFPLPDYECKIDVRLDDGSQIFGCDLQIVNDLPEIYWHGWALNLYGPQPEIVSWREHKDEITIDWPTESGFSFGSDK